MSATVTILYLNEPNATYDLDYYSNIHMPLVQKHWTKYGLKRWSICKLLPNADGSSMPFVFYGVIELESVDKLRAAFQDAAIEEMMSDVKNYASIKPVILMGELVRDVYI